jgi:predicted peptidase
MGCGGAGGSGAADHVPDPSSGPAVLGQQVKQVLPTALDGNIGGYLEYLPGDHGSSTHTYPLLIFCHGAGEVGDGSDTSLDKVAANGVPKLIRAGTFPAGFTVAGETYSFIVISPQFKNWPAASNVTALLDHLRARDLRIDPRRIYITGLSMGGGATWDVASNATLLPSIAAAAPVCGAQDSNDSGAKRIADSHLPVWAFHNDGDPTVSVNNTLHWIDAINGHGPAVPPRKTIFTANSHDAWTKAYDPSYRESINGLSMNVYEWLLFSRKP